VESSSEEERANIIAVPIAASTSTAAPLSSVNKPKSFSSSGTDMKLKSSTSSSLPQRSSSSPLREAFALAVAKSASVKKTTARIPAHLTKELAMPLATELKTFAALNSSQIHRYVFKNKI
jgi:hypothetical protein